MSEQRLFKLPISYQPQIQITNPTILSDLELIKTTDNSSLYQRLFNLENPYMDRIINLWSKNYTTNTSFLKDTQILIQQGPQCQDARNNTNMLDVWNTVLKEDAFKEKYMFIELPALQFLNKNAQFLQAMSIYNIGSPLFALALPIICLIVPFFIIKLQGHSITLARYIDILKIALSKHSIGQIFHFATVDWDKRIYIIFSLVFYAVQMYQNIISCIKFFTNMRFIHQQLNTINQFLAITIPAMDDLSQQCTNLSTYHTFIQDVSTHCNRLRLFKQDIDKITGLTRKKFTIGKFTELGQILQCFYTLYNDVEIQQSIDYSLDFTGYIMSMKQMHILLKTRHIGLCKFTKSNTKFTGAYFAGTTTHKSLIRNTYNLKQNMIITGPNAAGKTTILKATIFNTMLSQQFGYGCYKTAQLQPYDQLHCYLNIPDTTGRDSLFQAEARRCKEILDLVQKPTQRHLCVFDELYSGTNPYEAIASATALLRYLNYNKRVDFVLTTHFTLLCENLAHYQSCKNMHMHVSTCHDKLIYKYKLKKGISRVKGGVQVLKDLNYPNTIIQEALQIIQQLQL